MTQDYFGQIPEDFNPNDNYGCNDYNAKTDWDFKARESLDAGAFPSVPNSILNKLIRQHPK